MSLSRNYNPSTEAGNNFTDHLKWFLGLTFLLAAFLVLVKLFIKCGDKFCPSFIDKVRAREKIDVWNSFAKKKLNPRIAGKIDYTGNFFHDIGQLNEKKFESSTNQIIQFGISTGNHVISIADKKKRKLIGYDISPVAIQYLTKMGVEARSVDLNSIDSTTHALAYKEQLKKDLSVVSDVLLIRILEYIEPEARKLLIITAVEFAPPGSRFYIDILSPANPMVSFFTERKVAHRIERGTIQSLLKDRKDLKFELFSDHIKDRRKRNRGFTLERMMITKLKR